MDSLQESNLCRRLATICMMMIDRPDTDENRTQQLADEADEICRQLGLPITDRALLGKPFVYGETELQP